MYYYYSFYICYCFIFDGLHYSLFPKLEITSLRSPMSANAPVTCRKRAATVLNICVVLVSLQYSLPKSTEFDRITRQNLEFCYIIVLL